MPQPGPSKSTSKTPDAAFRETLASVRLPLNALLTSLSQTTVARRDASPSAMPTTQAYTDLVALSKLSSAHITALGIALKPKADFSAAKAMLERWLGELGKMELLVGVWMAQCQNEIWDREIRWAVLGLVESYQSLHATLASATSTRQGLLSATGQVWSATASLSEECSPSVQAAYSKALHNTQETIKDAHAELRDLIDFDSSDNEEAGQEQWQNLDDLGFNLSAGPTAPLEAQEEERVKGLSMLIRLCRLLHKRIGDWTLKCSEADETLDQLYLQGEELSATIDEVVGAAQESEELQGLLGELKETCQRIAGLPVLTQRTETLEDKVQHLSVSEGGDVKAAEERTWRDMAFAQIQKAIDQIQSTFSQ